MPGEPSANGALCSPTALASDDQNPSARLTRAIRLQVPVSSVATALAGSPRLAADTGTAFSRSCASVSGPDTGCVACQKVPVTPCVGTEAMLTGTADARSCVSVSPCDTMLETATVPAIAPVLTAVVFALSAAAADWMACAATKSAATVVWVAKSIGVPVAGSTATTACVSTVSGPSVRVKTSTLRVTSLASLMGRLDIAALPRDYLQVDGPVVGAASRCDDPACECLGCAHDAA